MYQLNERVSALFNKTKNCTLSTNGEYPNTIVIMFKEINAQGEILLCDVFMNKTLANLEKDAHVSVVVYEGLEGYQIKGTAEYAAEGAVVDTFKAMVEKMFNGAATAKGASVVPILQSICGWAGIFYREDNEKTMTQCQRCDHHN